MINKHYQALDVKKLVDYFKNRNLIIDESYQRRKVWIERDRVRLIETILLGYVIPALYFWDAEIDPNTGNTITHIVDGQQRVSAVIDFIENKFKLQKSHLSDDEISERCGNKAFHELSGEDKLKIWGYQFPIVQLSNIADKNEIKKIFYRLNLTDYNLNAQEKRHSSSSGEFADLASELAELEFWDKYNLFNKTDLSRMGDIEFCASLLLLARKGIVNQTDQTLLNQAYDDFKDIYEQKDSDKQKVLIWIDMVEKFINEDNVRFLQRKSQLFTMFCVAEYINRNSFTVNESMINSFNEFVNEYLTFKNTQEISGQYNEKIKQYKLAASEGVNKQSNRMIRFEILRDIIIEQK